MIRCCTAIPPPNAATTVINHNSVFRENWGRRMGLPVTKEQYEERNDEPCPGAAHCATS